MSSVPERIQFFRRRIAKMARRAEAHPARGALVIRDEVADMLQDLRRLARAEPVVVLDILFLLLERIPALLPGIDDRAGQVSGLIPEILNRVQALLVGDASASARTLDARRAYQRLLRFWLDDQVGHFQEMDALLLERSTVPEDGFIIRELLRSEVAKLPLIFPLARTEEDEMRKAIAHAERHRPERLLGEILARDGRGEYAVIVAEDHYRRTGDALDFARALERVGKQIDAIFVARKALASPRSAHRQKLQEFLDDLVAASPAAHRRPARKELEKSFYSAPSRKLFLAIKSSLPGNQWPKIARRLLGHLQKHQREPCLVFQLYVEEGCLLDADGMVVTQEIDPEILLNAARRIQDSEPLMAAGWIFTSVLRRASHARPSAYPTIIAELLELRQLCGKSGQTLSFERSLARFYAKVADAPRLLRRLREAGLTPSAET